MGFNCLKTAEPLQGDSLLFIIQFSTLKGWKDELASEPPGGFEHEPTGLGTQCLNH